MTLYDKYISDVLSGKILVPETILLAVQRHQADLEKSEKIKKYPYYFDREQADKYIRFISMLRLTDLPTDEDGLFPNFDVQPFQAFFIASIAGWRRRDNPAIRKYKEVYFQIARKNGKSTLVAAMMVAHFYLDKMNRGQFFTAATSREQAGEVFEMAKAFIEALCKEFPEIADRTHMLTHAIIDLQTKSSIKKVSKEAKTLEGKGSYCSSLDEYHVHPNDKIKNSIKKGSIKYKSPIIYVLTTPGFEIQGVCHRHYEYCKKILKGILVNETIFIQIYEVDDKKVEDQPEPFHNKKLWIKANPNMGNSPHMEALEDEYTQAVGKGGFDIVDFKTKILSMWVSSSSEWIPDEKYMACCTKWDIRDYIGAQATAGLDLAYSHKGDICAFSMYLPDPDDPTKSKVHIHYWIPEDKALAQLKENSYEIDYIKMTEDGWLTLTPGDMTDYDIVLKDILWYHQNFKIHRIYFDAWNVSTFYNNMDKEGLPVFKLNQNLANMSPPTKEISEMIYTKNIDFGLNPMNRWMMSNVNAISKNSGNIQLDRSNADKKIDGIIATVMAKAAYIDHIAEYKPYDPQIIKL